MSYKNSFTSGLDYFDIDEGLGSFLHPGRVYLNNNDVDAKWHTKKFSAFGRYEYKKNGFTIDTLAYYENDMIVDDSGFAYTYTRSHSGINYPPGTKRHYYQNAKRYGLDVKLVYQKNYKMSFVGGMVIEKTDT